MKPRGVEENACLPASPAFSLPPLGENVAEGRMRGKRPNLPERSFVKPRAINTSKKLDK